MRLNIQCLGCGESFEVIPARAKTAKFCSYKCRGKWRSENFTGENNPNYRGGRNKACAHCGKEFWVIPAMEHRKFCSKPCADIGGIRYSGPENPNYRKEARRKNRGGSHHKWTVAVISRDKATCQRCGATGVELHAHHILSFKDHPERRSDVNNGVTLCFRCHWDVHSARNEKAVKSVKTQSVQAEGNTEPSSNRKVLEGVTTRGRAYRRIEKPCDWCGSLVSRAVSDVTAATMFCDKRCAGKYRAANRTYRPWANPTYPTAVISSTSPAPERDEIV